MPNSQMNLRERAATAWRRFYDWKTEHQFLGRYSVDKLQQFDRYQSSASLWRCLGVITLLSVVPAFALVVGIQAIPVVSPDLGIKHNVAAVVRSAIGHAVFTITWVFYTRQSLGTSKESHSVKLFALSGVVGGLLPEGFWTIVSFMWRYPVPCSSIPKMAMTLGCIVLISRCTQTKESRTINRQRIRIITIVMAEYLLIIIFCLLLALAFSRAPWVVQLALIVIQPPLRSLIKRQSWVHARKLSDLSTDVTLNIVDISSSMYQTLCIRHARNELAALIIIGELLLGLAVARMYSTHTFIVDGCRTLQTAIKIIEGSLSSTLVVEEDETQKEEPVHPDETLPSQSGMAEDTAVREEVQAPKAAQRLRRASSDTVTSNSQRSARQLAGSPNDTNHQASKYFPTGIHEVCHVIADPGTGESNVQTQLPPLQQPASSNTMNYSSQEIQPLPQSVQRLRHVSSSDAVKGTSYTKAHRLHRRMSTMVGGLATSIHSRESPLSPKNVYLLRRTASDSIQENNIEHDRPRQKSGHRNSTGGNTPEPRLQSWARDPVKVYCFTDSRPEVAPIPQSPKQGRPSQSRRSSIDLPPLTDLHSPEGFDRRPSFRRSTSVFLTPRTLMKHGSKRLLDLGRSTGRNSGSAFAGVREIPQKGSMNDVRKPSQVNIDGMLVVRKDQARILEQTLQLLFSCEVLVVAEFITVLVPFLQGILLTALWTLPSAHYNILLRDLSKEQMLEKMVWCLCFSAFGLPALALVCVTVFKKYGISPMHLLAFLLEQHYANFQTKLTSCFIALTFSTSVHQGMDWISK